MKAAAKLVFLSACLLFAGQATTRAGELSGTSWHLVKITSMDDSVDTPASADAYTLELGDDGRAALKADCNRGMGGWTSEAANQIRFSQIASTRALCPPGSLSDKYLAQFQWVRGYVIENGHLFLATMADGPILEFAPATASSSRANVLGETIESLEPGAVQAAILERLLTQYARDRGIEATPPEVAALVGRMERDMAAEEAAQGRPTEDELTAEEKAAVEALRTDTARSLILHWKINKSLYGDYGGRIIYQQFGPEPLDAYRLFLEEQQAAGAFSLPDETLRTSFWRYFTDDSLHDFMLPGSADEKTAFSQPPWADK